MGRMKQTKDTDKLSMPDFSDSVWMEKIDDSANDDTEINATPRSALPFSIFSFTLVVATVLACLGGTFIYKNYNEQQGFYANILSIEKAASTIITYDGIRDSAIQQSLSTANPRYKQTYDTYQTPYEHAFSTLERQTISGYHYSWRKLIEAKNYFDGMNLKAFSLLDDNKPHMAKELINGVEYQSKKIEFEQLLNHIKNNSILNINLKIEEHQTYLYAAAIVAMGVFVMLFGLSLYTNKTVRSWQHSLRSSYSQIFRSKQAERNSKQWLDSITKNSSDGILSVDKKGFIVGSNPTMHSLTGMDPALLKGKHVTDIFTPACTSLIKDEFELFNENGSFSLFQKDVTLVMPPIAKGQDSRSVKVSVTPILTAGKQMLNVQIRDLTEQINQRNQVIDSMKDAKYASAYLKSLLLHSPDAIIITNDIGSIELFNPAAEKLFGYSFDEIAGKKFKELFDTGKLSSNPFEQGTNMALGMHKNGERFQIRLSFSEFITDEGIFYTSFIRKGSEQQWIDSHEDNSASQSISSKVSVLLAEDNPINLTLTKHTLEAIGCKVTCAEDGKSVLKHVTSGHNFDTVVLSTHVPDIDGFKLTRLIRNYEKENHKSPINIIGLIASIDSDTIMNCLDSGMTDYCHKPLDKGLMRNKIARSSSVKPKIVATGGPKPKTPILNVA